MVPLRNIEREEKESTRGVEVQVREEHLRMSRTLSRVLVDVLHAAEWTHAAGGIARIVGAGKWRIGIEQQILSASVGLQVIHRDVADVTESALGRDAADERVRCRKVWIDAVD